MAPPTSETSVGASTADFVPFTIESSHPYYLHPSDSPGTVLVTSKFNGSGYGGWRRSMLIGLSCKNKLGLINETLSIPAQNSPYFEPWCRANDMVLAWILNSLELEIRESVMYTESAEKLWKDIERRYGQANGTKVHQIRKEIASISQGSSNIASYFSKLKKLWDELAYSITYPACTCGCKEAFQKIEEEQRLHQFLMGLNEVYSGVRRNILMTKPLPDVDTAYSMLINDESQIEAHIPSPAFNTDAAAFSAGIHKPYSGTYPPRNQNAFTQRVNFDNRKNNMFCRYCKKPGHVIGNCRKLSHQNNQNSSNFTNNSSNQYKRTVACVQGVEGQPQIDVRAEILGKSSHPESKGAQFSPEQLTHMMNMLQQMKSSYSDQGTSDSGSAIYAGPFTEEATGAW